MGSKYFKDRPHTKPDTREFNQALYDFFSNPEDDFVDGIMKLLKVGMKYKEPENKNKK